MKDFGSPETWNMKVDQYIDKRTQRPLDFKRRNEIKNFILSDINNFKPQFPGEKYIFNFQNFSNKLKQATGRGTDPDIANQIIESLDSKIKNKITRLDIGQSSSNTLTQAEKDLFSKNYKTKTLAQMATEMTDLPYNNQITKNKYAQIYRYQLTQTKLGNISKEDVARGARPKGTTPEDVKGFGAYRKAQQKLMDLDPEKFKDLTPAQVDSQLKKALQFDKVAGAFDVPENLKASFEHKQGITPGTITQDPEALTKVGVTTRDFNFNVLGAKGQNNLYKTIKNELRTAKAALKIGDKALAEEAINKVNSVYDNVFEQLGTVNRNQLPNYRLINNSIKETNLKPIDLDGKKRIGQTIEDYIRFVAAGPKQDIANIKQPNLKKAINLLKQGKEKAFKKLVNSRLFDVKAGKLFSILPASIAAPIFLSSVGTSDLEAAEPGTENTKETSLMDEIIGPKGAAAGATLLTKPGRALAGNLLRTLAYLDTPLVGGAFTAASIGDLKKDIEKGKQTDVSALELTGPAAFSHLTAQELGLYNKKTGIKKLFDTILRGGGSRVMAQRILPVLAKGSTYATPLVELGIQTYNAKQRLEEAKEKYGTDDMVPTAMGMAPKQYVEELASELPDIDRTGAMGGGIMRINLKNGPDDPSKRKFMKLGLGIASLLPFGIGRLAKKPAVQKAVENAPVAAEQGWSWIKDNFWTVVDTVKKKASGFSKLKDGEVRTHKDMEVIDGPEAIRVRYKTDNGNTAETVYIKPSKEVNPETGEIIDVPGQFEEYQDVYRMSSDGNDYYKDFEEEIIDSVDNVKKIIKED
jgi:hypothetical protein